MKVLKRILMAISDSAVATQWSHISIPYIAIVTTLVLAGKSRAWLAVAGSIVFAVLKEGYIDPYAEDRAIRGSDAEDFAFYLVGILAACLVVA